MYMPKNEGGDFELPPAGTHLAVCYRVIDLGTQQGEWKGQPKLQHKIMISWELPSEPMSDGKPFAISQFYTFSSYERARLRQDLEGWRGKAFTEADFGPGGFDIKNILGKACLLNIVHADKNGSTYANIASVSAVPKGMPLVPGTLVPVYFSLDRNAFDRKVLEGLSQNLQGKITSSPEYKALLAPAEADSAYATDRESPPVDDSDVPF